MQPFRIACCQVRAYDLEDAEANLQNLLRALDEAGAAGAQLVLLPECSYPAYYVRDANPYAAPGVRPFAEVLSLLGERARRYGYWLAGGIATPHDDGSLTNSGLVFDPSGALHGRYDKSFLWHFDSNWFRKGSRFPVFDAGFARFGILICADGRQPEIARMLTVNGAEIICDLTAWVSWGRAVEDLTTTQCEYLMPVRALENGVWVAAADKWGTEDGTIVYAGRSCVIDPMGVTRVCAPSNGDTVVVFDVEPMTGAPVARRPELYGLLDVPTESLLPTALEHERLSPAEGAGRIAIVPGEPSWDAQRAIRRFVSLRDQDCDVVVFGGTGAPAGWRAEVAALESAVQAHGGTIIVGVREEGPRPSESVLAVTSAGVTEHLATHGPGIELGEMLAPLVQTDLGLVGVMAGMEGFVPEVARSLALAGADVIAWPTFAGHPMLEQIARARSDENRIYVALAWPGGGIITNPDGALITAVPAGTGVAMAAPTHRAFSRWKERAPHTHVIRDRAPEAFRALTRETSAI